jgi:hypothetical protein
VDTQVLEARMKTVEIKMKMTIAHGIRIEEHEYKSVMKLKEVTDEIIRKIVSKILDQEMEEVGGLYLCSKVYVRVNSEPYLKLAIINDEFKEGTDETYH